MFEIVPTAGLNDHVTEVVVEPVTVASSCCDCDGATVADVGVTLTLTAGRMFTVAAADFPIDGALASTVTVVWALIVKGAV